MTLIKDILSDTDFSRLCTYFPIRTESQKLENASHLFVLNDQKKINEQVLFIALNGQIKYL